jgi:hypothetical protein
MTEAQLIPALWILAAISVVVIVLTVRSILREMSGLGDDDESQAARRTEERKRRIRSIGRKKTGRGKITLISLAAILVAMGFAWCGDIKLAWNANPEPDIAAYEVKATEVWGMHEVKVRTSTPAATVTGLKCGVPYLFCVRAENTVGLMSFYSDSITATPLPLFRVTIQKSDALGIWTDTNCTINTRAIGSGFFRGKIELIPEGGTP